MPSCMGRMGRASSAGCWPLVEGGVGAASMYASGSRPAAVHAALWSRPPRHRTALIPRKEDCRGQGHRARRPALNRLPRHTRTHLTTAPPIHRHHSRATSQSLLGPSRAPVVNSPTAGGPNSSRRSRGCGSHGEGRQGQPRVLPDHPVDVMGDADGEPPPRPHRHTHAHQSSSCPPRRKKPGPTFCRPRGVATTPRGVPWCAWCPAPQLVSTISYLLQFVVCWKLLQVGAVMLLHRALPPTRGTRPP